jgi:hypothetical protein
MAIEKPRSQGAPYLGAAMLARTIVDGARVSGLGMEKRDDRIER